MTHLSQSVILSILGAIVILAGCRPVTSPLPASPVTADDAVTVSASESALIVDVVSPRGIGAAQVSLPPAVATQSIQVRFHLAGLEQAVFDNGAAQLTVAVSSHPPFSVAQTLTADGVTRQLAPGGASWAAVELVTGSDAPPAIPLPAGYIAVTLPAGFIDVGQPTLALRWIDFYR
jgi:hypothetical protein